MNKKLIIESNVFNDLVNINKEVILVDAQTLKYDTLPNAIEFLNKEVNEFYILDQARKIECVKNIENFENILSNVELNDVLKKYYTERIQDQKNILNLSQDILKTNKEKLDFLKLRLEKVIELSKLIDIKE